MITKYHVEYAIEFRRHYQVSHFQTDDPVACVEFLVELLERGYKIKQIKHEGVSLPQHEVDRLIKTAGGMLASKHICHSLSLKPEEERHRFGFTA